MGVPTEPYSHFARIYDRVMKDVGYDLWFDYIAQILGRFNLRPRRVLDLACGTGNTCLPFAHRGYEVTGLDRSAAMLDVARAKASAEGLPIVFIEADMRRFALDRPVDLVTCLYDSLNYVLEREGLRDVCRCVHDALTPGGAFIFDVNSAHRLSSIPDTTMFVEDNGFSLVWENKYHSAERIWQINLTGFLRTPEGLFRQFKETHRERAYQAGEITEAIRSADLEPLAAYSAYSFDPPDDETARVYYVARRGSKG